MAELQTSSSKNKYRKVSTPRVDLTPMVDLGFLLITFFMYTTTLAQAKAMDIQMPNTGIPTEKPTTIPGESTLIIIPAADHRIAYYSGLQNPVENLSWCGFSGKNNLRNLIETEIYRVKSLPASLSKEAHKLHVIIKPDTGAAFEDIVHTLDEMTIADVPYSTVVRITNEEQKAVKKYSVPYGK